MVYLAGILAEIEALKRRNAEDKGGQIWDGNILMMPLLPELGKLDFGGVFLQICRSSGAQEGPLIA
jgi:hypothetical protein